MENNLGFFARSKGADKLRKEVEGKVQVLQTKIDCLKKKLKLIPHEQFYKYFIADRYFPNNAALYFYWF